MILKSIYIQHLHESSVPKTYNSLNESAKSLYRTITYILTIKTFDSIWQLWFLIFSLLTAITRCVLTLTLFLYLTIWLPFLSFSYYPLIGFCSIIFTAKLQDWRGTRRFYSWLVLTSVYRYCFKSICCVLLVLLSI